MSMLHQDSVIKSGEFSREEIFGRIKISKKGCWNWQGYKEPNGYGVVIRYPVHFRAHRVAFFLHYKKLPSLHILHKCDNPSCINPAHLFAGTDADNVHDKVMKGRHPVGTRHANHKLNNRSIRAIRKSSLPHYVLAKRFGVHKGTISKVVCKTRWQHIA